MIKFRLYFDKDKETEWLNSMAQDGWAMSGFFGCFYIFDSCEKGAYQYQIDFTDRLWTVSNDYREFMQEIGAEIVANWGFWTVLRKSVSEGKFELYTDVDSSIEHYTKIRRMFKIATVLEVICLCVELLAGVNGVYLGFVFACLLGAIAVAFANIGFKTDNIVEELKERKTGIASERRRRRFSPLLSFGLIINWIALLMPNSTLIYLQGSLHILAIFLMVSGLVATCRSRKW